MSIIAAMSVLTDMLSNNKMIIFPSWKIPLPNVVVADGVFLLVIHIVHVIVTEISLSKLVGSTLI